MQVILLKDVRGVGQHGEIKNVRDGYATNCLFPRKLAEAATEEKIKEVEAQAAARAAAAAKEEEQLTNKIQSLRGKDVHIPARATEKGGLFRALGAVDIMKAILAQHSLEIPDQAIDHPVMKAVGEYEAHLKSKNVSAPIKIVVTAA